MFRRLFGILIFVIVACASSGVALAWGPDIAVINLSSNKVTYPPNYDWRQVVIQTDKKSSTFTTMARGNDQLVIRKFDEARDCMMMRWLSKRIEITRLRHIRKNCHVIS